MESTSKAHCLRPCCRCLFRKICFPLRRHYCGGIHDRCTAKEFGVSLAAEDQNVVSSIAGAASGYKTDKVAALKELGYSFFDAEQIKTVMVEGASLNIECKLKETLELGSHTMYVGEVINMNVGDKQSLAYHAGKYWRMSDKINKPVEDELKKINDTVAKYTQA